jgi:hypothetical protein
MLRNEEDKIKVSKYYKNYQRGIVKPTFPVLKFLIPQIYYCYFIVLL